MSNNTIYADQHKLAAAGSKLFKDIEVPPRKLLLHNKKSHHHHHHLHHLHHHQNQEIFNNCGSPAGSFILYPDEEMNNNLHKFLPFNNSDADSDPDSDPYASDHFRMYEFKIRRCTRSRSHDWTDCPFAHPGEKARRRDPRRHPYSGTVCSEYRRGGGCSRGDDCEFAHGVFECWLHPSRYRTEACKDGKNCKRKVCFFAHSPRQLRILPELSSSPTKYSSHPLSSSPSSVNKNHYCCMYCHHHSLNSSPTSTLLGKASQFSRSPSLSPPLSPAAKQGYSPVRLSKFSNSSEMSISYKDMLNELMSCLDVMSFNNDISMSSPMSVPPPTTAPWIDVNSFNVDQDQQQQQFVLSPSTPSPSGSMNPFGHQADHHHSISNNNNFLADDHDAGDMADTPDPDLEWVNELLM